ncbi:dihydrofolate reductase family protein [Rathayibacter sp. KR2-224]|uniref:dihydrofolate reductase family protein n=1 Tax=Rathayibacter sp. KR2-224 TaxID=3400913 RepID=UPI003C06617F
MTRFRYYVASSLDGFIADRHNAIDWLTAFGFDEFTADYERFTADVGAIVMGSSTYEFILGEGTEAYGYDVPAWVLTHRELPVVPGKDIRFFAGDVAEIADELVSVAGSRDVWLMGGGDVVAQFAQLGRLDELIVTVMPVVLGAGAPLLPVEAQLDLRLTERSTFPSGAVGLRYDVVR